MELLFTDNNSSDDSLQYLNKKYGKLKNLVVIKNGKNYGYAEGNNRGIKRAKGDYILVCNNDLELNKNLVKELVKVATSKNSAATVPKLMFANKPGLINNAGSRLEPNSSWPVYEIGMEEKDSGQYEKVREITAFCGACVLFSREFLQNVGLFDPKFFMYFEDGDLSWRGQKAGYKYYFAPKAIARHIHAGSSKAGSPLFNHYVGRNRVLILAKNASWKVLAKGMLRTLYDHGWIRIRHVYMAIIGKFDPKLAYKELFLSVKMMFSIIIMLPYSLLKRYNILKEDRL